MRALLLGCVLSWAGCGCGENERKDAGTGPTDAGTDAGIDAGTDAGIDAGTDAGPTCETLELQRVTSDLSFPIFATAPAGDDRIFVVEHLDGLIVLVDDAGLRETPFLDLLDRIDTSGYEAGLLGLVFHPDYADNGRFYVSYTTPTATLRISRFQVGAGTPDVADPDSESIVIEIPQLTHHNTGGMMLFGPDGYLYIVTGDDDDDPDDGLNPGQDLSSLNSRMLRIDVDGAEPYEVPPDNPFVGDVGVPPEVWLWGLREPYRFWFDTTGDLYIADVGQVLREEIDVIPAGEGAGWNFGWPTMEGTRCHTPPEGCDTTDLVVPVFEYDHGDGSAIIGGSVYRGAALSQCWQGRYFFGDYPSGWVKSLQWDGADGATDVREKTDVVVGSLVSFGVDGDGEILILGLDETLDRIVARPE